MSSFFLDWPEFPTHLVCRQPFFESWCDSFGGCRIVQRWVSSNLVLRKRSAHWQIACVCWSQAFVNRVKCFWDSRYQQPLRELQKHVEVCNPLDTYFSNFQKCCHSLCQKRLNSSKRIFLNSCHAPCFSGFSAPGNPPACNEDGQGSLLLTPYRMRSGLRCDFLAWPI